MPAATLSWTISFANENADFQYNFYIVSDIFFLLIVKVLSKSAQWNFLQKLILQNWVYLIIELYPIALDGSSLNTHLKCCLADNVCVQNSCGRSFYKSYRTLYYSSGTKQRRKMSCVLKSLTNHYRTDNVIQIKIRSAEREIQSFGMKF